MSGARKSVCRTSCLECPTLCPGVKVLSVLLFIAEGTMEDLQMLTDKLLIISR